MHAMMVKSARVWVCGGLCVVICVKLPFFGEDKKRKKENEGRINTNSNKRKFVPTLRMNIRQKHSTQY